MFDACIPSSDLPVAGAFIQPTDGATPDSRGFARQARAPVALSRTTLEAVPPAEIDPSADVRRIERVRHAAPPQTFARSVDAGEDLDESTEREPMVLQIGGLDRRQARALVSIGILSCGGLLQRAKSAAGRREIAETTGVDDEMVRAWLGRAELLCIPGIDGKVLRLLEATGVHSALQLAMNRTELLFERLALVNVQERLLPTWPDVRRVAAWIRAARRDAHVAPA